MENFFALAGTQPAEMRVGLYQDRDWYVYDKFEYENIKKREDTNKGDVLDDSDDIATITTEPTISGSTYARQTLTFGTDFTVEKSGGNWRARFADLTFDVTNPTQTVNALFCICNFQSDDVQDSVPNDHLFATIRLQNERDLSIEEGQLTFKRAGLYLS